MNEEQIKFNLKTSKALILNDVCEKCKKNEWALGKALWFSNRICKDCPVQKYKQEGQGNE